MAKETSLTSDSETGNNTTGNHAVELVHRSSLGSGADGKDDGSDHEGPFATDLGADRGGPEGTKEGTGHEQ